MPKEGKSLFIRAQGGQMGLGCSWGRESQSGRPVMSLGDSGFLSQLSCGRK